MRALTDHTRHDKAMRVAYCEVKEVPDTSRLEYLANKKQELVVGKN